MSRAIVVAALALVGCGVDAFIPAPDDAGVEAGVIDGSSEASDAAGSWEGGEGEDVVDGGALESGELDAKDAADASEPCPMIGSQCSPIGLRKCRGPQTVWYCGGTWTSNACTQGNPACMPCEAGYCCTISPVCP